MSCSACDSPTIEFVVPEEYREYAPETVTVVSVCTRCLRLEAAEGSDSGTDSDPDPDPEPDPDFSRIGDGFPTRSSRAIPLALAIDRCSSLATNREAIETLLRAVERAGADPLLAIDRLVDDPGVDPSIDLERRRHQLEQLLY
ncbi:hypothetical protein CHINAEXTREME_06520 [Halobiforma lacisalsi AJ5]|uniref:Uncharacterized protein n=1 Tax=Natronobacterium lacisalsi AJ5 TaxID=358396 RepID=M0LXD8_NATLA|nr:DUF6276 family protein [Halobiforma lacisalsi]APW97444.1 hypothetical protein CHINAEXTREME_06520 [Halobiforma lacisalsi AJ5]EMA38257.1 hypothetical protein C445_00110 [Halobiforma lacisalsi AJ5]